MRGSGGLLALAAAAALPTCSQASTTASPEASPAARGATPQLAADVQQFRRDAERRIVQIALTNTSTAPVTVEQLALSSPAFAPVPPTVTSARLEPGWRTNFPVPYGATTCGPGAAAAPAVTVVSVRTGDGAPQTVELSLAAGADDLERVRARDCTQQAVQRAVQLSLEGWEPGQEADVPVLRARLRLRRGQTEERLAVDSFGGNVLYTIHARPPGSAPLVTVREDEREAVLPVEVRATRCDPHALAESKQSYVFRLYLAVGAAPAELTTVRADEAGSRLLDELAARTCLPGR